MSRLIREALSYENAAGDEVVVTAEASLENQLALEQAALETSEALHAVEKAEHIEEELSDAHASLESIVLSMEAAIAADERGLDRISAEGYTHAVRAVVGDVLPMPVQSLESFGGDSERAEASQLSLEGIKETAKKIWEGIKRAIAKSIAAVADFFAKMFNGADKLEKRVAELKSAVAKAKADKLVVKDDKMKVARADSLAYMGKIDAASVLKGAEVAGTLVKDQEALIAGVSDIYQAQADFLKAEKADEDELDTTIENVIKSVSKTKSVGQELPGGKAVFTKETDNEKDQGRTAYSIGDHPKGKTFSGSNEVEAYDISFAEKAIAALEPMVKTIANGKGKREALKKDREAVVKAAESWVKAAADEKIKDKAGSLLTQAQLNGILATTNRDHSAAIAKIDGYLFTYARSLASAVDATLSNMGPKAE